MLEDACPCPKAPCGLVMAEKVDPKCPQHATSAARTIRQGHEADSEQCKAMAAARPRVLKV
jgi:hypothetical protein